MSREGRSQPIQPFAAHGFLGNTPANGTPPGQIVVIENGDDRRRKTPPLQPLVLNGLYASVIAPAVAPPKPTLALVERLRPLAPPPISISGALLVPPPVASVSPPAPLVVSIDDRLRRSILALPIVKRGYDDPAPPQPELVERDDRRRRSQPQPPISVSGVLAPFFPPTVTPPAPLVVVGEDGKRRLVPQPIVLVGREFPPEVVVAITAQTGGGRRQVLFPRIDVDQTNQWFTDEEEAVALLTALTAV